MQSPAHDRSAHRAPPGPRYRGRLTRPATRDVELQLQTFQPRALIKLDPPRAEGAKQNPRHPRAHNIAPARIGVA